MEVKGSQREDCRGAEHALTCIQTSLIKLQRSETESYEAKWSPNRGRKCRIAVLYVGGAHCAQFLIRPCSSSIEQRLNLRW
jgi:hypothetical protein